MRSLNSVVVVVVAVESVVVVVVVVTPYIHVVAVGGAVAVHAMKMVVAAVVASSVVVVVVADCNILEIPDGSDDGVAVVVVDYNSVGMESDHHVDPCVVVVGDDKVLHCDVND